MSGHLGKIALMLVMSHGFRAVGRLSNPRWAGLALGLPCSTAVALVGGGVDRGVDFAVKMSGDSLLGLAGAEALPMAYSRAIGRGWKLRWALGFAVGSYLLVAIVAGRLLPSSGDGSLAVAALAVLSAVWITGRISPGDSTEPPAPSNSPRTPFRVARTLVPIACLLGSLCVADAFGPRVGGLMSTFPGLTLTVLVMTHLESGAGPAIKMARALPSGNLGMVAFLAAFRFASPVLGLGWGTASGYLAALAMLVLVVSFGPIRESARCWFEGWDAPGAGPVAWPRAPRRFSPYLETVGA